MRVVVFKPQMHRKLIHVVSLPPRPPCGPQTIIEHAMGTDSFKQFSLSSSFPGCTVLGVCTRKASD